MGKKRPRFQPEFRRVTPLSHFREERSSSATLHPPRAQVADRTRATPPRLSEDAGLCRPTAKLAMGPRRRYSSKLGRTGILSRIVSSSILRPPHFLDQVIRKGRRLSTGAPAAFTK